MTTPLHQRIAGIASVAGPLLLLGSTIAYVSADNGMKGNEAGGALQVWAMIVIAVGGLGLARRIEAFAPRTAALLGVLLLVGMAGGVAYGVDVVQSAVFGTTSVQETTSPVTPIVLQLPGIVFPLSLITLGLTLARTGAGPKVPAYLLAVGALLFPMSRIPDIAALAVASDVFLCAGLVPLGLALLRSGESGAAAPAVVRSAGATA